MTRKGLVENLNGTPKRRSKLIHFNDGEWLAKSRAADIIKNWIRNRGTFEFLGTWEQIYNPEFKVVEFDHFKMQAGLPSFVLGPGQWIEKTNAIGLYVRSGIAPFWSVPNLSLIFSLSPVQLFVSLIHELLRYLSRHPSLTVNRKPKKIWT